MNILHIVQRYHPAKGGSELYMKQLSEYLVRNPKHKVTVMTVDVIKAQDFWAKKVKTDLKKEEKVNGVRVLRFKSDPFFFKSPLITKIIRKSMSYININLFLKNKFEVPSSCGMLDFIKREGRERYDVVHVTAMPHGHLFYVGYKIVQMDDAKFFITPFIHLGIDEEDEIRRVFLMNHYKKFYLEADKVFVQTDAEKETLQKFIDYDDEVKGSDDKFVKVGLGLDTSSLRRYNPQVFRKQHKLKDPIVFYVGNQCDAKGTVALLNAMGILWKKGVKVHLVLAGEENPRFKKLLEGFSFKDKVLELGRISEDEKHHLFSSGTIFCMVSKSDSFGIVYLESWFYKIPVIACDTPVFAEIVSEGKDGFLCEFGNEELLAEKLESLINNPEMMRKMGEFGMKKIQRKHQLKTKLEMVARYYKK